MKSNLIYGLQSVKEALLAGTPIDKIYIRQGNRFLLDVIKELIASTPIVLQEVPVAKLDSLCPGRNHQGIIAQIALVNFLSYEDLVPALFDRGKIPLLVGVEGVTDVRNIGAIARTAEAMGADALLVPTKGSASLGPDAVKTSSGALLHLPICRVTRWGTAFRYLKQSGLMIIGCTEKAEISITDLDLTVPLCLLMGGESTGIPQAVLKICDAQAKIKMYGKIQSLNVSVAFGMVIYEAQRQRNK
ncbi:MAG: 23S rRNA (guanosine(2251)-2'-O)-methyltransferase RlmB [Bacteroidia bacterium]|nr:23S rRNA (guanosine(2251)-2'-O)-methyltransferase RlmB [Bacteroidia bacterium]MDW8158019.1 23S rRNA (guanosine(2251)-2'-O)-methyltransferase RlmB [Bacteroidia bacterium]